MTKTILLLSFAKNELCVSAMKISAQKYSCSLLFQHCRPTKCIWFHSRFNSVDPPALPACLLEIPSCVTADAHVMMSRCQLREARQLCAARRQILGGHAHCSNRDVNLIRTPMSSRSPNFATCSVWSRSPRVLCLASGCFQFPQI
jgi:hypothetical protein